MLHRVRWICAPRDNNTDTYWQSDGPQPHLVNIQFHKKVSIKEIGIYCDFKQDESYTPSKISIRAGTHFHDLQVRAPTRALLASIAVHARTQSQRLRSVLRCWILWPRRRCKRCPWKNRLDG